MSLTFKDLSGKVISFKTSSSRNAAELQKPDYFFNETSYPEFFLKAKSGVKKTSMETFNENFSFNNFADEVSKKVKREFNDNFQRPKELPVPNNTPNDVKR